MQRIILSGLFLFLFILPASADKVFLNSGEVVEGKIVEKNPSFIKLEQNGGLIRQFFEYQYKSYLEDSVQTVDLTDKKRELINQVINLTGMKTNIENNVQQIIDKAPLEQRSQLREIFIAQEIIDAIIPFYAKYYSEAELKDLIKFYQSPTGKKVLEVTPQIAHDAMQAMLDIFKKKVNR